MRYQEITEAPTPREWRCMLIYGSFDDPETGMNFFIVRIPDKRVPWSKRIAPAIDRLVRSFFTKEQRTNDLNRRRMGRESLIYWNVDGDDIEGNGGKSIWDMQKPVTRYEWNGTELVKVERSVAG